MIKKKHRPIYGLALLKWRTLPYFFFKRNSVVSDLPIHFLCEDMVLSQVRVFKNMSILHQLAKKKRKTHSHLRNVDPTLSPSHNPKNMFPYIPPNQHMYTPWEKVFPTFEVLSGLKIDCIWSHLPGVILWGWGPPFFRVFLSKELHFQQGSHQLIWH